MANPLWIEREALLALHTRTIALHGGAEGLRDPGLLESALIRPVNRHHYDSVDDLAELAATYAAAISANHPFVDGNKRAAFQCMALFLRLNGARLRADPVDATRIMFALAAGRLDTEGLATWIRANLDQAS